MTLRWLAAGLLIAAAVAIGVLIAPGWGGVVGAAAGFAAAWVIASGRVAPEATTLVALGERLSRLAGGGGAPGPLGIPESLGAIERRLARSGEADAERAEQVQVLLDAIGTPIVAADGRGLVTLCNAAAQTLIGAGAASLIGRPMDEAFTGADVLRLHAEARAGRPCHERIRIARGDGVGVFEATASPLPGGDAGSRPVVITLLDVTEPALAVQVKTDFVANASHELRTPIAALRLAAETLQGGAADDAVMRDRLIRAMAENTLRLEEMVRDLMDLSKLESPDVPVRVGPVPGSDLRRTLSPIFEPQCADRRVTLSFDLDPALEGLHTDRELLLLILKNLIDNAAKFANEGTEVRVVGRPADHGDRAGEGRAVRFEVIDQGVGIPLAHQQRIFERFYQVDQARTGTAPRRGSGLGLSIVKHAVRTLGGTIRVQSVWKQGTTMTVELPGALPAQADGDGATDG